MENKNETKVTYDDRRKEMTQHLTSVQEIKIDDEVVGENAMERKATFTEKGIKKIFKNLDQERTKLEQSIKKVKDNIKEIKELTPELKELEKNIQIINDYNKAKQMKSQIETQEKDLKIVKKDIRDIRDTIGSRLKL